MTSSIRSLLLSFLLVGSPAVAQASTEHRTPTEGDETRKTQISSARERGVLALRGGNYVAAAASFQQAANLGDVVAMRHLGDMAFAGTGVAQNYQQAVRWHCRAALAGSLEAAEHLVTMDLGGWSESRNAQGWEAACERWLKPKPPPQPVQPPPSEVRPEVAVEVHVEQEPVREVYVPYFVRPSHPPGIAPPHPPKVAPRRRLGVNPLYPPPMPLLRSTPKQRSHQFKK